MKAIGKLFKKVAETVKAVWKAEPTAVAAAAASAIVFAALKAGIVLPEVEVLKALAGVLPILFGGALVRSRVTPTK